MMRVVFITAGAGGMYCGACARDTALARALLASGCDAQVVPLYTPMKIDVDDPPGTTRMFFGGINVWLEQHVPFWRRVPRWLRRGLDSRTLLRWVSKVGIQTEAAGLGPMTVSMLKGEDGRQAAELGHLIDFLSAGPRPDVVNLANALLSGLAPALKERLGVRVFCELQGGDGFVAAMPEPYRTQVRDLIRRNARDVDLFISPSEAYIPQVAAFLDVPAERIAVLRTGLDAGGYPPVPERPTEPFTVGYMSRIVRDKGLDLLVEACRILAVEQGRDVRLRIAGQRLDRDYWDSIEATLRRDGLVARCDHFDVTDRADKIAFLHGCSAFSVPSRAAEIRATSVLEAMAAGIPVAVPDAGVFPEIVRLTGGGVLFPAGDAAALADELGRMMDGPQRADALGRAARAGIHEHYSATAAARGFLDLAGRQTER